MNLYNKYLFPHLLDLVMKRKSMMKNRSQVAGRAFGVVLEIGFGSGLNLPFYKKIEKLYALEPSEEILNLARKRAKKFLFPIEYLPVGAENIPLANNTIDSVISSWNLCTIPDPDKAMNEVFRVLKPGGKFFFIEHGRSSQNFPAKLQNIINPVWKRLAGGCHLNRDVIDLVVKAGFKIEEINKYPEKYSPLNFIYKGVAIKK